MRKNKHFNILAIIRNCLILTLVVLSGLGCTKDINNDRSDLTIIFINDQHGQIDNFGKLMAVVEKAKENNEVIVACSGDMFSGNPVVDIYEQKGYPMIELMNHIGFDIAVIGNHEFDYGQAVLADRIEQAEFAWVCANLNTLNSEIPQPAPYSSIKVGDLKITFLGLVETNGKADLNIPSTHPLKVKNIEFERPENVVSNYADIKEEEGSDLYIALTHLGHNYSNGNLGDFQLAYQYPYFDLIIGGHSNPVLDTTINGIPVFQAGNYLNYAGKIDLVIENKEITSIAFEAIDLNNYPNSDPGIQSMIDEFNADMESQLEEVIGYSEIYHDKLQLGCFYTEALRESLDTDLSFQNYGGIRNDLNQGEITIREIYEIDPFNNGAVVYTMSAEEIRSFLKGTSSWHAYSGIQIEQSGGELFLRYPDGNIIDDNTLLTVGINDYIPSVNDMYFPENGQLQSFTTAEALIDYLKNTIESVNYPDCPNYFKYQ